MPLGTRRFGSWLFVRASHNAGHAVACVANGKKAPPLDLEPCRREALGLHEIPDMTAAALICWTGPAAEAIATTYAGATDETVALWMWSRYYNVLPPGAVPCDSTPVASADPAILTAALAIVSANWADIERLARTLVDAHPVTASPAQRSAPAEVLGSIDTTHSADISASFNRWQQALIATRNTATTPSTAPVQSH
jgi:hypothetical protein